ncbi:MAG: alkylmercury lyase family protein [Gammaproteobacteria bacterium]|nr:alkylmercury lyase family protein [Gammaproteobacteria bacterium]
MHDVNGEKTTSAVAKLNQQLPLTARQRRLPEPLAAAHRAMLRSLAERGRPLDAEELAALVGTRDTAGALERLGKDDLVVLNSDGTAVGAYPMTIEDTPHRLRVNGRPVHAMCALDAVSVGPMFDAEVAIESRCAVTGEPIRIRQRGAQILAAEPSDDVRVGVRWQQPEGHAAHSMCMEMVFLKDGETARRWLATGEGEDKSQYTLDDAVAFGAGFFLPLVE